MVVGVKLLANFATEHFGFFFCLDLVSTGVHTTNCDTGIHERLVVGTAGEFGTNVWLVNRVEVVRVELLKFNRTFRHLHVFWNVTVVTVSVQSGNCVVVGTDHVVVEVRGDLAQLFFGQGLNVVSGSYEPNFFSAPNSDTHLVVDVAIVVCKSLSHGENTGYTRGVVVDARTFWNTVQVCTKHVYVIGVTGLGFSQNVPRLGFQEFGFERQRSLSLSIVCSQLVAERVTSRLVHRN